MIEKPQESFNMTWTIKKSSNSEVLFTKNLLSDATKDLAYLDFDPYKLLPD